MRDEVVAYCLDEALAVRLFIAEHQAQVEAQSRSRLKGAIPPEFRYESPHDAARAERESRLN